jgi:serpin B
MLRNLRILAPLFVLSLAAAGCETPPETNPTPDPGEECHDADKPGCVITSDKQRITSPDVPPEDRTALVTGNSSFALDLYQEVRQKEGNLFYSPFSISTALAMTYAGAKADTETAMAETLHFTLPQDKLHPAFNWLDLQLESRGQGASGADGQGFRLNVVNALWGQIGYNFEAPFLDTLAQSYGAGMHIVDFAGDPQGSADLVNGWVSDRTEGKIEKLVPASAITPETVLILTNAIYFNAAWKYPFETANTKDGTFTLSDGSTVTVPMMHNAPEMQYGEGAGYQAVSMPYDGDELSMIFLLPEQGTLADFEASLDAAKLGGIVGGMTTHQVDITMPKFKFEYELGLKKTLESMGMEVAFQSGVADFTGINSQGKPYIQDVLHKAFIGVNEAGTEAAAATAVIIGDESAPEPAAIALDRPFLFVIRDDATGSLLFVGRVADPTKG